MNFCPNCGSKLAREMKFCGSCGAGIGGMQERENQSADANKVLFTHKAVTLAAKSRNSAKMKIIFLCLLIALFVAVTILIFTNTQRPYPIAEPGATRDEVREYLRVNSFTHIIESESFINAESNINDVQTQFTYDFSPNSKYCLGAWRSTMAHVTKTEARLFLDGVLRGSNLGEGQWVQSKEDEYVRHTSFEGHLEVATILSKSDGLFSVSQGLIISDKYAPEKVHELLIERAQPGLH